MFRFISVMLTALGLLSCGQSSSESEFYSDKAEAGTHCINDFTTKGFGPYTMHFVCDNGAEGFVHNQNPVVRLIATAYTKNEVGRDFAINKPSSSVREYYVIYELSEYPDVVRDMQSSGISTNGIERVTGKEYYLPVNTRLYVDYDGVTLSAVLPFVPVQQNSHVGIECTNVFTDRGLGNHNMWMACAGGVQGYAANSTRLTKVVATVNLQSGNPKEVTIEKPKGTLRDYYVIYDVTSHDDLKLALFDLGVRATEVTSVAGKKYFLPKGTTLYRDNAASEVAGILR